MQKKFYEIDPWIWLEDGIDCKVCLISTSFQNLFILFAKSPKHFLTYSRVHKCAHKVSAIKF
jgi:hypothetical protein